ncbi:MAG: hypothetical protein ACLVEJ_24680 [Parabacteroides sp.]
MTYENLASRKTVRQRNRKSCLGLLVSEGGYPLSYSLFNGSQYEGYTMIPMIDDFKQRFSLGEDFIIVADSGLMNKTNVELQTPPLDAEKVSAEYNGLWVVERAFRISKGSLEMRPIFHFTERRIEAHMFAFALSPIKYMRNWSELSKKRTLT